LPEKGVPDELNVDEVQEALATSCNENNLELGDDDVHDGKACDDIDDGSSHIQEPSVGNTEVVYVREAVSVWPTSRKNIDGRLTLIKQDQVMFLAWLPYTLGTLNEDGTFNVTKSGSSNSNSSTSGTAPRAARLLLLSYLLSFSPPCVSHRRSGSARVGYIQLFFIFDEE
jgi:hypothetical protein